MKKNRTKGSKQATLTPPPTTPIKPIPKEEEEEDVGMDVDMDEDVDHIPTIPERGEVTAKQSKSILLLPDRFCMGTSHEMRMLGAN